MLDEQNKIPNVKRSKVSAPKKSKQRTTVKNAPRVTLVDTSEKCPKIISGKDQQQVLKKIKADPSYPTLPKTRHQTNLKKRSLKCKFCLRTFTRRSSYTRHLRIHMKGTPLKCYICRKRFFWRVLLDGHLRSHSAEKPLKRKIWRRSSVVIVTSTDTCVRLNVSTKPTLARPMVEQFKSLFLHCVSH